jgi:hypothetical protein
MISDPPDTTAAVAADAAAYVGALRAVHTTRAAVVADPRLAGLADFEGAVAALDDRRRALPAGLPTIAERSTT